MTAPSTNYDFNKEDKLYLENIGIEYRFGCYSEKKPDSCHMLGDYLEVIKKDFNKAAKVYKANCEDSSYSRSCFKIGSFKFLGTGTTKSLKDSLKYYNMGCSEESPDSCLNGGLMCVSNAKELESFPKDYKKGIDLLERACDYKNAFSCHYLAGMNISGVPDYMPKNMENAFEYSTRACDLGNIYACANMSQMYKDGEGVEIDLKKSEELKERFLALQKEQSSGTHHKLNE